MNRTEWLEMRKQSIGASDAVVLILGELYGRTQREIRKSKIGDVWHEESADMRAGNTYEPLAVQAYADGALGRVTYSPEDPSLLTYHAGPWVHASCDAMELLDDLSMRVIEVKSPRESKARETELDGPSIPWVIQTQFQMAVLRHEGFRVDSGVIVVWHREEARIHMHEVPDSAEDHARAAEWIHMCSQWYEDHIIRQLPLVDRPRVILPRSEADIDLTGTGEAAAISWYAAACQRVREAEEDKRLALLALTEASEKYSARRMSADGVRITRVVNKGRTSLDVTTARIDHPEIPWESYERTGSEYLTWRVSGGT